MKRILVIVPAYNEAANIGRVVDQIRKSAGRLTGAALDVIVINDGSQDATVQEAEKAGAIVISLPYNLGIGGAVQTGFKYANAQDYDIAVQNDGDGQHDPEFIGALIEPILNGKANMVIGSRFLDKKGFQSSLARRAGIKIFQWVNSLIIRQTITDNTSGFRAYDRKCIARLAEEYPVDYPEPEAVIELGLGGCRIAEIPVIMRERMGGQSSISSMASAYYMVKVLLAIFVNVFKKH